MLLPRMHALAVSPCLSFYHFVGFSEQFVLTGKCHTTLSALTAPPPTPPPLSSPFVCFSTSFSSLFSFAACGASSLPTFHILSCPPSLSSSSFFLTPSPSVSRLKHTSTASVMKQLWAECTAERNPQRMKYKLFYMEIQMVQNKFWTRKPPSVILFW